jgi:hypothetical protein
MSGILLLAVSIIFAVLLSMIVYYRTKLAETRYELILTVDMVVAVNNEILRAWAAHAATENLEGFPIRIEMDWNHEFDRLESAAIVIRQGFTEVRHGVILKERIGKARGSKFNLVGAFTFEETPEEIRNI